ncbi:hypothetical protein [Kordia sp.]|uniref:hypothetical protein n=1 Tax=Kordia sp. TaxID=1965332 RepID=UPI003B59BED7
MKKQFKTLGLKKQTISSLEAQLVNGGLRPKTMRKNCVSQRACDPLPPQDPRPGTAVSRCTPCSTPCN